MSDLRQLQRYYGSPSDQEIIDYSVEAAVLVHRGYLRKIVYGFRRAGAWVLTLEYTSVAGTLAADDRAGGVYRHADVAGAQFYSYLFRTDAWWQLSTAERHAVDAATGIRRSGADALGYAGGQHTVDRAYSARGTGLQRSSYRPL